MDEILFVLVMVSYSISDPLRDSLNSAKNKRPNHKLPWPLIDRWHAIKKFQLYLLPSYILACCALPVLLPESGWSWAIAVALSAAAWKLLPVPEHWK